MTKPAINERHSNDFIRNDVTPGRHLCCEMSGTSLKWQHWMHTLQEKNNNQSLATQQLVLWVWVSNVICTPHISTTVARRWRHASDRYHVARFSHQRAPQMFHERDFQLFQTHFCVDLIRAFFVKGLVQIRGFKIEKVRRIEMNVPCTKRKIDGWVDRTAQLSSKKS